MFFFNPTYLLFMAPAFILMMITSLPFAAAFVSLSSSSHLYAQQPVVCRL